MRALGLVLLLVGASAAWVGGNYVWLGWRILERGAQDGDVRLRVLGLVETGPRGLFVGGSLAVLIGVNATLASAVLLRRAGIRRRPRSRR